MQTFIFSTLTFYIICSMVADVFLLPIKVKRASWKSWSGTNEPGISRVMDSFPSEKFPGYKILHNMKKRDISYPSRQVRAYDTDYGNEEYTPEFYPYNNVGSLYVDGDRVVIKKPLFNFGVNNYDDPIYGPSSYEEVGVTT